MRIGLLTYNLYGGGAERMVARLSSAFFRRGHDVDILLLHDTENRAYEIDYIARIVNVADRSEIKIRRRITQLKKLSNYIQSQEPDVIICFLYTTLPFPILANIGIRPKVKVIGTQRTNPKIQKKMYRLMVLPFLRFSSGMIFQTDRAKRLYPKWVQRKSAVIGNIAPQVEGISYDEKEQYSICTTGRLSHQKDYATIFRAMSIIVKKVPEAILHIYGDGEDKDNYVKKLEDMQIRDNVIFHGFSKHVVEEIRHYKVFLFSSKAEGMPNSLLEAMAAGLACVATDCEFGPAELIENGINGFLVPVSDPSAMAEQAVRLLKDEALCKQISEEAAKVKITYSEDNIVYLYMEYIKQVCNK